MLQNLSKKQYSILIFLTSVHVMSGVGIVILTPFYPKVAEEKGVTAIYYSSVFSCFNLAWFLVTSFCGFLVRLVDPYVIAKTSTFTIGVTNILFGYLDKIYDKSIFLSLSYILRIVEAYGFATFTVAAFCIAANEFPDDIGFIIGIFETGQGVGYCLGPAIGGALYMLGGFNLPFTVLGLLTLFVGIIAVFLKGSDYDILLSLSYKDIFKLLRKKEILLALWSEFAATFTLGINNSNLEPQVRVLNLSPTIISLFFSLSGFSYCIASLSWGKLCDKGKPPQILWCIAAILMCVAYMCMGPAPYLKISLNVPLCCFGFIMFGVAVSGIIIPSFFCLHKVTLKMGFADDVRTYSLVSSIFNSIYSIGSMSGSMAGGLFSETIGLAWGYQIIILFYVFLITVTLLYNFSNKSNDFPNKN